jgi:hypothetical protein
LEGLPIGLSIVYPKWEIQGRTVHQTIFGEKNFGNGAYAILQYLKNGDLLFNSFSGPVRVHYER